MSFPVFALRDQGSGCVLSERIHTLGYQLKKSKPKVIAFLETRPRHGNYLEPQIQQLIPGCRDGEWFLEQAVRHFLDKILTPPDFRGVVIHEQ